MMSTNPLLKALSKIPEIADFSESVSKNANSKLVLTSPIVRSYFIGAISLKTRLVVVSDDAFGLYQESFGVTALSFEYIPIGLNRDIVPRIFNKSESSRIQSIVASLPEVLPNVIYTSGDLGEHVAAPILENNNPNFIARKNDSVTIGETIKTLIDYGYTENEQAKYIGDFARRGGIIDVFPNNTKNPVRIEFDSNVISSIRFFNPVSQLSIEAINFVDIPKHITYVTKNKSITYRKYYQNLGYEIIFEEVIDNECVINSSPYQSSDNYKEILIHEINLNSVPNMGKYLESYPDIYIVGKITNSGIDFLGGAKNLDGYIYGNILIDGTGIAVIAGEYGKKDQSGYKNENFKNYYSYNWGDVITHVDYGIGIYRGVVAKNNTDYLQLEYANNATVYVSAHRVDLIAPHVGSKNPKLNSLGNKAWSTKKRKTRTNIKNILREMIEVDENRRLRREKSYKKEDYLEKELGKSFPYIETEDQKTAINDIYNDLTTPGLMDRIIIGDVGYGKTEIAIRAAAKAAFSNIFVMVVVPTTILADQHYILFKNRLENFGISVEMLSRFITTKKQNDIIKKMHDNRVDILVGTHKLLGEKVPKNRLGLLIVDDEHRFGVVHKNKLLKLKKSVDVLTLTATPIPRTLQQSLLGLKSVSLIGTPPLKRVPIKTQVIYKNWKYIKNIMEAEIMRGGQIYFLHNNIESITFYEKKLVEMLPGIKIASAHGGMKSRELEKIILSFFDGDIQVLVSTTIIESGIDVPNANTIIITASHMYGLSQLYQIRGRVGRGDRQGYCYLVIPKKVGLSDNAIERLKTIQENTSLGSGYRIAIKDLELRGAGNVFGYEQSGHISNIGYHLYCKMFNEEINKSRGLVNNFRVPKIKHYESASLDDAYVPHPQDRLYYYQRLSTAKDIQELNNVKEEIADRHGKPGKGTINLYKITEIRIAYTNTLVKNIQIKKNRAVLTLINAKPETPTELSISKLMSKLENSGIKYRFKQSNKDSIGLEFICSDAEEPVTALIENVELFYYENNNT